ncbi:Sodium/hydrogen exchanger [Aphelenchoides bicaudatus]|nr:Sodium/hydrogen exchanger [Aphelenchoides bicaudatus]
MASNLRWLPFLLFISYCFSNALAANHSTNEHEHHGVKVASFKFEYVKTELILALFIVLIGIFKIIYHHYKYPRELVPESCCLILIGVLLGLFFFYVREPGSSSQNAVKFLEFDSKSFFFFLLPPIILEASYSLNDSSFSNNLGTIILFAVVGTVLNIGLVGGILILLDTVGVFGSLGMSALDCLLFASLIAAVDPVAVLAIFKEVGVNKVLYFMVFGESLLNDAVTVVCYNLVNEFKNLKQITPYDCFLGMLAFLCVSLGGLAIGIVFGLASSFITRFTICARVVEPVICITLAYLSYVCAELFHFSGIISLITCGIIQSKFTMNNLSAKSNISIMYAVKVISAVTEDLIFIILGVMLINENSFFWSDWHPLFAIFSLILCVLARFTVVFGLTYVVNMFTNGVRYISLKEQVIMAYGGLRGAVSFSLAFMISDQVSSKSTILAATYIIILFTVFCQGCSIEFLVRFLNIALDKKDDNFRLFNAFNKGMVEHMAHGVEDLLGVKEFSLLKQLSKYSKKYLQPILERDYMPKDAENKLISIENEERIKENLRQRSFHNRRQGTIDAMASKDSKSFDLMDEHHDRLLAEKQKHKKDNAPPQKLPANGDKEEDETQEEIEAEVEELADDLNKIQALVSGSYTYYPDRNLCNETLLDEQNERRQQTQLEKHLHRLANLHVGDMSEIRQRRGLFLGNRKMKKMSITKGLLGASMTSVGAVSSHHTSTNPSRRESANEHL